MTPPDSGEHDVFQRYLGLRMQAQNATTEAAQDRILEQMDDVWRDLDDDERARVRQMVLHGSRDTVFVPLPIAQRILAALEEQASYMEGRRWLNDLRKLRALATELRAAISK